MLGQVSWIPLQAYESGNGPRWYISPKIGSKDLNKTVFAISDSIDSSKPCPPMTGWLVKTDCSNQSDCSITNFHFNPDTAVSGLCIEGSEFPYELHL